MLKQRVLTAIVLLAVFAIVLIWFNLLEFAFVIALLTLAMAWEWSGLVGLQRWWSRSLYLLTTLLLVALFAILPALAILIASVLLWCVLVWVVTCYGRAKTAWLVEHHGVSAMVGLLVLPMLWVAMNTLFAAPNGRVWLLSSLIVVWVMDTGGYFCGRRWGRRKLCERVSPGKTWEGLFGGLVVLLPVGLLLAWWLQLPLLHWLWLLLAMYVAAIFAAFGDLYESVLKRHAGVKDSGQLLPGHGGVLDRMDGVLAGLPVMAIACIFLA